MISIAPAQPDDVPAMARLFEELERFYGAASSDLFDVRIGQIKHALFSSSPAAHALLAKDGELLVGIAAYSFLWPAVGLTRSLYLKELYVAETHRARGVGKLLMGKIFEIAQTCECSRVEWTTDLDNPDAQRFYDRLGFSTQSSKVRYRVEGPDVVRAAKRLNVGPVVEHHNDQVKRRV